MRDDTTISVKKKTMWRLVELGRKGETYDALVNKLIDVYLSEKMMKKEEQRLK